MNCKKVRDLLTEYLDGEIEPGLRSDIARHISSCQACRELAGSMKKFAIEPLANAQKVTAPEGLWDQIRARIDKEEKKALDPAFLIERLFAYVAARRPALAFAAAAVVIIAVATLAGLPLTGRNETNAYIREQVEFYSYLDGENGSNGDSAMAGLGSSGEDYFL